MSASICSEIPSGNHRDLGSPTNILSRARFLFTAILSTVLITSSGVQNPGIITSAEVAPGGSYSWDPQIDYEYIGNEEIDNILQTLVYRHDLPPRAIEPSTTIAIDSNSQIDFYVLTDADYSSWYNNGQPSCDLSRIASPIVRQESITYYSLSLTIPNDGTYWYIFLNKSTDIDATGRARQDPVRYLHFCRRGY
jgi:hypothetical protein